jgi:hypothetical protein
MTTRLTANFFIVVFCASSPTWAATANDHAALLRLHEDVMEAHRTGKADLLLRNESSEYMVAGRGEISRPSLEERRTRFTRYLGTTRFSEYVDVVPPVVKVSADGSLGWVIVQVRAKGVQTSDSGKPEPLEFESAWIELYERGAQGWQRVGNVSNFKP